MSKYILLSVALAVTLGIFSFGLVHAFFTSGNTNAANTFSAAAIFPTTTSTPTPTSTPSADLTGIANHMVISEVQVNGGPGHADYDFIELYNPTSLSVDLNGFRLISRTGNSSSDDLIKSFTAATVVPAHGFYLWASSHDSTFPGSINANTSTTVGLTNSMSIALRNGPNDTGAIIDALSWNNGATIGEGANAATPAASQSLERKAYTTSTVVSMTTGSDIQKGNGYDGNNNATDFILRPTSQPQNSASPIEIP